MTSVYSQPFSTTIPLGIHFRQGSRSRDNGALLGGTLAREVKCAQRRTCEPNELDPPDHSCHFSPGLFNLGVRARSQHDARLQSHPGTGDGPHPPTALRSVSSLEELWRQGGST